MQRKAIGSALLLSLFHASAHAGACEDKDSDGYGVYPDTSTLNGCAHDGIDCDDSDPDVHPFAQETCGNSKDDNCRHGVDEGCGADPAFDGWRVMPVRSEGEFSRGELGGRAEQWLQGATRCIADPNVIYLSHDCSVIWRSRDGGQTWEKPLSHGLLLAHGQSIQVDPVDCNRILVVAAEAWNYKHAGFTGIYLSEDGGDHFDYVQKGPAYNSRRYEHDIAFSPSSADAQGALVWYTALYEKAGESDLDQAGLYRSNDRGRTWERHASLTDHDPVYEVQVSPSSSDLLVLASNKGLFRSSDGGATLQPLGDLPNGAVTSIAFSPTDATTLYAVVRESSANGLYRSTNGGDTFVRLQSSDSLHQSVLDDARRVFVHPKNGDVFYVVPQSSSGGRTAIRTENGGTSFSTASISLPDDIKAWRWGLNISGNFAFILMSSTDDKQVVAQSGGAALYRSSDGDVFVNGSSLYTGANCGGQNYSIAFDSDDPQRLVLAHQDIGVYMTENGGNFFVSRSVPHAWVGQNLISWSSQWTVDIHPTDKNQFVSAVGSSFDRKIVRTTNAGSEWTLPGGQSGNYFRVVHHPYDGNVVLAGKLRSQNGGTSFSPIPFPSNLSDGSEVMDLCRSNPDVVYAASRTTRKILRSEDKGETWSEYVQAGWSLAPFDPYFTFAVDPVDCGVVYTVDADGDLARFDGSTWTSLGVLAKVSPPTGYFTYVRAVMVDPNHPEVIYAGLFGAGLPSMFRSTDSGATWEDVSFNRFREGFGGINISPHSGEVFVGGCSGTWVLPPPYPTNDGIYDNLVPRPSCIDGIQNGEEQGIDCGGTCPTACGPGGEPLPDGGMAGAGGSGGSSSGGSGGSGGSSGATAGSGGSDPGADAGPGTGGSAAGEDDGSSSDGCGCRTLQRSSASNAGWLFLLSMLGVALRRIRKS